MAWADGLWETDVAFECSGVQWTGEEEGGEGVVVVMVVAVVQSSAVL